MKKIITLLVLFIFSCNTNEKEEVNNPIIKLQAESTFVAKITIEEANNLLKLPLKCVQKEYPNKLGQVIGSKEDLKAPKLLHPAFYGCFDWHSSVHGHWTMVKLLKEFPDLEQSKISREILMTNLSKENIVSEIAYFQQTYNTTFERTYGWAWVLKLAEELYTWDDPLGKELAENIKPLTKLITLKYQFFLPKLNYPIRVGEHTNTAFGLSFAWDYAHAVKDQKFKLAIESRAKEFYMKDNNCPMNWEPSGFDFLSPCLEEAELMARVLTKPEFENWLSQFLPSLKNKNYKLEVGKVSDRTDGKLVHIDGLNFSRAWALLIISKKAEGYDHLIKIANEHIKYSLPNLTGDSYEGGHWLGSFAVYAVYSY